MLQAQDCRGSVELASIGREYRRRHTSFATSDCAWDANPCDAPGWREGQSRLEGAPLCLAKGWCDHETLSHRADLSV